MCSSDLHLFGLRRRHRYRRRFLLLKRREGLQRAAARDEQRRRQHERRNQPARGENRPCRVHLYRPHSQIRSTPTVTLNVLFLSYGPEHQGYRHHVTGAIAEGRHYGALRICPKFGENLRYAETTAKSACRKLSAPMVIERLVFRQNNRLAAVTFLGQLRDSKNRDRVSCPVNWAQFSGPAQFQSCRGGRKSGVAIATFC